MSERRESRAETARREWVERHERFKDLEERYERQRGQSTDPAERRKLAEEFAAKRRAHREADIALGKRSPGTASPFGRPCGSNGWKSLSRMRWSHDEPMRS